MYEIEKEGNYFGERPEEKTKKQDLACAIAIGRDYSSEFNF
jgi:hypothetical protein